MAGGVALNQALVSPRISSDLDLFHDSDRAVEAAWNADREVLEQAGFEVVVVRERPSYVEARVRLHGESTLLQWARDSAFRFFPLVADPEFGLTLHPVDLATNKVLALIGRAEPRDWIDIIHCDAALQPLGYLAWAACGKDPGFSPQSILSHAARTARYTQDELDGLAFAGAGPDAKALGRTWHEILATARTVVDLLPAAEAGKCVLDAQGALYRGSTDALADALAHGGLVFHAGALRGAIPTLGRAEPGPRE